MPTYLCHGFRWHRKNIRIFPVLHDIDDAAPEWVIAPASSRSILATFRELYDFLPPPPPPSKQDPAAAAAAPERPASIRKRKAERYADLSLLEEYDPNDLETLSGPYAYVADHVVRVDLSAGVAGEMARYEARMKESGSMSGGASDELGRKRGAKGWLERLRAELEAEEDIRWYVVVCGDEERDAGIPAESGSDEGDEGDKGEGEGEGEGESEGESGDETDGAETARIPSESNDNRARPAETLAPPEASRTPERRRGLRRFLSDLSLGGKPGTAGGK